MEMARVRCITEMGMGVDVHGRDATKAGKRAVSDAIRHSSLGFFRMLGKTANDMFVDVTIAVPNPERDRRARRAGAPRPDRRPAGQAPFPPPDQASTTSVSTEEIVGRCSATACQLSPSSALAKSVPPLVPK